MNRLLKILIILVLIICGIMATVYAFEGAIANLSASVGGGVAHPWRSPFKIV